jgi:hypothetical protein
MGIAAPTQQNVYGQTTTKIKMADTATGATRHAKQQDFMDHNHRPAKDAHQETVDDAIIITGHE